MQQVIHPTRPYEQAAPKKVAGAPSFIKNISGMPEGEYALDSYVPGFGESVTILPKHAPNGGVEKSTNPYGQIVMGKSFVGGSEGSPQVQPLQHKVPSRKPIAGVDVKMQEEAKVVDPNEYRNIPKTASNTEQQPMYRYEQPQHNSNQEYAQPQYDQHTPSHPRPAPRQTHYYSPEPPPPPPPNPAIAINQPMHIPMPQGMAMNQPGMPNTYQPNYGHVTDHRSSSKVYNPPPAQQMHYEEEEVKDVEQYISIPKKRIRVRISHSSFGNYRGNYLHVIENEKYLVLFYDIDESGYEPPIVSKDDGPITVSCEGKEHRVYYLGMDFELEVDNVAMQIYCKERKE